MKTVVSVQDLLEFEIRPEALLNGYARRLEESVRGWPRSALRGVPCPACEDFKSVPAFERFGQQYRECVSCETVYLSPRPSDEILREHARTSEPARFWRERLIPATAEARREKILLPRAEWVREGIAEYAPKASTGVDVTPHGEALLQALTETPLKRMVAVGWAADLEVTPVAGRIDVDPGALGRDDTLGPVDVVTAFETLDRAGNLPALVSAIHRVLRPNGLLFVTAPSVSGFELQVLWGRARSVVPPDKLNLLSLDGFLTLFSRGWEIIELSTPGMFDVESVRQAIEADPDANWPRAVRSLVGSRDEMARREFQEYLQRARLASFARLLVRRDGSAGV